MPFGFVATEPVAVGTGEVVDRAAYNARLSLRCARDGRVFDHTGRTDRQVGGLCFGPAAGPEPPDCETFWNLVGRKSPGGVKTGAIDLLLGLPRRDELAVSEMAELVEAFIAPIVAAGHPVQWDIHAPRLPKAIHAHVLVSLRGVTPDRRIEPINDSPFVTVVRGGRGSRSFLDVDWKRHWRDVQERLFRARALPLRVPVVAAVPPAFLAERKPDTDGRSKVARYREVRRTYFAEDDRRVHAALVRDRFAFDALDVAALLRLIDPDRQQDDLERAVDRIVAGAVADPDRPDRFSTPEALERLDRARTAAAVLREARFGDGRLSPLAQELREDEDWFDAHPIACAIAPQRLTALHGATLEALVRTLSNGEPDGALADVLRDSLDVHPLTIIVPGLASHRRLGVLANDPDVQCIALRAWLKGLGRPARPSLVVLFDAHQVDDVSLARLITAHVATAHKLVLVIDESDPPGWGCGGLASELTSMLPGVTVIGPPDPMGRSRGRPLWPRPGSLEPNRGSISLALRSLSGLRPIHFGPPTEAEDEAIVVTGGPDDAARIARERLQAHRGGPPDAGEVQVIGWQGLPIGRGDAVVTTWDLGTAEGHRLPLGSPARVTHLDPERGIVTLDAGRATYETFALKNGAAPLAPMTALPLRFAQRLGPRPIRVQIERIADAVALIGFAARSPNATIAVAPAVAHSLDALIGAMRQDMSRAFVPAPHQPGTNQATGDHPGDGAGEGLDAEWDDELAIEAAAEPERQQFADDHDVDDDPSPGMPPDPSFEPDGEVDDIDDDDPDPPSARPDELATPSPDGDEGWK